MFLKRYIKLLVLLDLKYALLFFIFRKLRDQESPENAFPACFDNILEKVLADEKNLDFSKISKNPIFKLEAEVFRVSQSAKNGVKRRV